jgi:hypothetical protein
MATASLNTLIGQSEPTTEKASGYWLFSRREDLGWFVFSLLVPTLVYLPAYFAFGSAAVIPLYLIYVVGFATPHTWLTWAVCTGANSEPMYDRRALWAPIASTCALVASVPLAEALGGWDLLFTFLLMLGVYHVIKQHLGILKIYDGKYASVHGDRSVFVALKSFHAFCTLAFTMPLFYLWTLPPLHVDAGPQKFTVLHPMLPVEGLWAYAGVTALVGAHALWVLAKRRKAGHATPTAHLALAGAAGLSFLLSFGLIAPKDYLLTVAFFITYHDLQYGGFVWNFHRNRSRHLATQEVPLDRFHRWARDGKAGPYFGLAFAFSLAIVALLVVCPPMVAAVAMVFHNTLHYFMDGLIWRRKHYADLPLHMGV